MLTARPVQCKRNRRRPAGPTLWNYFQMSARRRKLPLVGCSQSTKSYKFLPPLECQQDHAAGH